MPDPHIADLIRCSRGDAEAQEYLRFTDCRAHAMAAADIGRDILQHVQSTPGACTVMSALYAVLLRDQHPDTVIHMVAGELYVGDVCVFGLEAGPTDWAQALSASFGDWDGHCWIVTLRSEHEPYHSALTTVCDMITAVSWENRSFRL